MYAVEYKKEDAKSDKTINKKLPKTSISSNSILVPTLLGIASIIIKKKKYK